MPGVTLTTGGISVRVAETDMSGFARSVAVTTTACVEGIAKGAVYKPDELTEPAPTGLTDHDATDGPHVHELGEMAMQALGQLDQIAYIRYASVYRNFREASDFNEFLDGLRD